mgnify:CR=1 FL=1
MKVKNKVLSVSTIATLSFLASQSTADQVFNDEVIIVASLCVGVDCVNGENFNFDTVRLKENNLRIKFQDTSSTSSFPSVDWQLTANDSGNGGQNYFAIDNVDSSQTPFKVASGAKTNALYIADSSFVGLGTSAPLVNLHLKSGNSPALRLEQDGSSGFSAQTWDVAGNETNFFVRDVSNASRIPFKIVPGAPSNSIFVANDGDIGFETSTPDGIFDIAHPANANNHAVLVSPTGDVGINIDNGFTPSALFDVQGGAGASHFSVTSSGGVGVGTSTPSGRFEVKSADGNTSFFNVGNDGVASFSSDFFDSDSSICPGSAPCGLYSPLITIEETSTISRGRMLLNLKNNAASWLGLENTASNEQWIISNSPSSLNFVFAEYNTGALKVPLQIFNNGDVKMAGTLYANSSRDLKENLIAVKVDETLELIQKLPLYTWNYTSNEEDNKHIGPMAQDFYELFGLGRDNEHISSLDVNGVSLAAIQALYNRIKELESEIESLKSH